MLPPEANFPRSEPSLVNFPWPSGRERMNRIEKFFGVRNEAKIRFLDGEFEVLAPGEFVRCAVSGQQIAISDLRYWSVDAQEAYASAEISVKRYLELKNRGEV
jgi:hypothetical protein